SGAISTALPLHTLILPKERRTFSKIATLLINKRKDYSMRITRYFMQEIHDVVAEMEDCKCNMKLIWILQNSVRNCIPACIETYSSAMTLEKPHLVKAAWSDGRLFNHMEILRCFNSGLPGNPRTCSL
ncbi:Coenzyme Q-binding protein COQ10 B, mitochondrial, partial [Galemys pyrenaicus]